MRIELFVSYLPLNPYSQIRLTLALMKSHLLLLARRQGPYGQRFEQAFCNSNQNSNLNPNWKVRGFSPGASLVTVPNNGSPTAEFGCPKRG